MITIDTYIEFWDKDLIPVKVSKEVEKKLTPATTKFLRRYGLPTRERMYCERKTFLEKTTPLPEIILAEKTIDRSIRNLFPFFEFEHTLSEQLRFQGQEFIKLGSDEHYYITIDVSSGSVHYIIKEQPDFWPHEFPPPPLNQFTNNGTEQLGIFLTAEFLSRRERVEPLKKLYYAIDTNNTNLRTEANEEYAKAIDDLENEFKSLDYHALSVPNSYWQDYLAFMRED